MLKPVKPALIVALDCEDIKTANRLAASLASKAGVKIFKVGLGLLYTPKAISWVESLKDSGSKVFLDAKLQDIPETVEAAAKHIAALRVDFLTIKAEPNNLQAAASGIKKCGLRPPLPKLIAVGNLSDDAGWLDSRAPDTTKALALNADYAGCYGLVLPTVAISYLPKGVNLAAFAVGIREGDDYGKDISRGSHVSVSTARRAVEWGADYIIVGRSITAAPDPVEKAKRILAEISG